MSVLDALQRRVEADQALDLGDYTLITTSSECVATLLSVSTGDVLIELPWVPGEQETYQVLLHRMMKAGGFNAVLTADTVVLRNMLNLTPVMTVAMADVQAFIQTSMGGVWDFSNEILVGWEYVLLPNNRLGVIVAAENGMVRAREMTEQDLAAVRGFKRD
jgi:hypothetical protein